nr:MAG TPA: hypothetical protein [Crassvirales sp.]
MRYVNNLYSRIVSYYISNYNYCFININTKLNIT